MNSAVVGTGGPGRLLHPPINQDGHQHLQARIQTLRTAAHTPHP